ncbi:MAG TPA: MFS transporter [Nitrososphaeraceae archaeon]|nr:MFS transporter [Nitrososphaeraceae archaeon]
MLARIKQSPWITLAILSSIGLITMHAETMLLPAIPDIIREFHINYSTSSWILTAYLISGAVMTPIAGKLSDIYGKKKILLIIMIIYTIGVTLGGLSFSISFLFIARIIQGVGLSMFPIAFGIIRSQFPPQKLAVAQGIFISTFAGGSAVGLAVGGPIVNYFGWHATFFSIIPIAVALIVMVHRLIYVSKEEQESPKSKLDFDYCCVFTKLNQEQLQSERKSAKQVHIISKTASSRFTNLVDIKGAVTLAVTISFFLLALSYLENISNPSNLIPLISFSVISVVSLLFFIRIERKLSVVTTSAKTTTTTTSPSPIVNLNLMIHKTLLPININLMIVSITMFMVYQSIPILVRSPKPLGFGGDAVAAGNVQLPFMIISFLVSSIAGVIISKFGNLNITVVGNVISTIGFFLLFMFHSTQILISINLGIIAIGLSFSRVGGYNIVAASAPEQYSGVAYGMTVLLFYIGMAIGPAIAGLYMQSHQIYISTIAGLSLSYPSAESYNLIFLTAWVISLMSIGLALFLKKKMR